VLDGLRLGPGVAGPTRDIRGQREERVLSRRTTPGGYSTGQLRVFDGAYLRYHVTVGLWDEENWASPPLPSHHFGMTATDQTCTSRPHKSCTNVLMFAAMMFGTYVRVACSPINTIGVSCSGQFSWVSKTTNCPTCIARRYDSSQNCFPCPWPLSV
jgi:hypothetical protein